MQMNRTVNVCGRLLTMCCMRQGYVNNMSQAAPRYVLLLLLCEAVAVNVCESAAQRAVVWIGRTKQKNNCRENMQKRKDECFSLNKQDTKPGCSVAIATPARQLAFFL